MGYVLLILFLLACFLVIRNFMRWLYPAKPKEVEHLFTPVSKESLHTEPLAKHSPFKTESNKTLE
jgi:putative SOS response-associated peptidase YedK